MGNIHIVGPNEALIVSGESGDQCIMNQFECFLFHYFVFTSLRWMLPISIQDHGGRWLGLGVLLFE